MKIKGISKEDFLVEFDKFLHFHKKELTDYGFGVEKLEHFRNNFNAANRIERIDSAVLRSKYPNATDTKLKKFIKLYNNFVVYFEDGEDYKISPLPPKTKTEKEPSDMSVIIKGVKYRVNKHLKDKWINVENDDGTGVYNVATKTLTFTTKKDIETIKVKDKKSLTSIEKFFSKN